MSSCDKSIFVDDCVAVFRECDMDEPVFVCKFVWERSVTCVILKMTSRDRLLYCRLALIACVPVWLNAEKSLRNRVARPGALRVAASFPSVRMPEIPWFCILDLVSVHKSQSRINFRCFIEFRMVRSTTIDTIFRNHC